MPKRILLVDDNEDHLYITKSRLEQVNSTFKVAVVRSGEECLEMLKGREFDCIISDYEMRPGMNGIDLLQELEDRKIDVPVIVITDHGNERLEEEALSRGAEDYFPKSIGFGEFDKLIHSVNQAVDRHRDRQKTPQLKQASEDTSEQHYQALFEESPDVGIVLGIDGMTIKEANKAASEIFGRAETELSGSSIASLVHPEDRTELRKLVLLALKGRRPSKAIDLLDPNGERLPFRITGTAHKSNGRIIGAFLTAKPIEPLK